jgi:hypothetical protein
MTRCKISIPFSGSAQDLINHAASGIRSAGGEFTGDVFAGDFSMNTPIGSVKGSYNISGEQINIEIAQKPMLVSCQRIEEELRKRIL